MDTKSRLTALLRVRWAKLVVGILCLVPLSLLAEGVLRGTLSANPIEDITHETGTWTLRLIMITLAVTPLRELTGLNALVRFRRMLGLFAFFYGSLHLMTYLWLDQFFDVESILADIPKRPFITIGFASFVMMVPLALTSADRIARWMGGKRWKMLHRMVYATAVGGVIHYLWLVKADIRRPLLYGAILAILLTYRIVKVLLRRRSAPSQAAPV